MAITEAKEIPRSKWARPPLIVCSVGLADGASVALIGLGLGAAVGFGVVGLSLDVFVGLGVGDVKLVVTFVGLGVGNTVVTFGK